MNVELAEQIIGIILMEPSKFNMASFLSSAALGDNGQAVNDLRSAWPCGTTACIAGHATVLTAPAGARLSITSMYLEDGSRRSMDEWAAEALGIREDIAFVLFFDTPDDLAVMALKYLIGNPDATVRELRDFLEDGRD